MNLQTTDQATCGCETCPSKLADTMWATDWEDPIFSGKQCQWHLQIRGKRGCISPDVLDGQPAIFVQLDDKDSRKDMDEVQFTVPLSELSHWARTIGAKRK